MKTEILITIEPDKSTVEARLDGKLILKREDCRSIEQAITVALRAACRGRGCSRLGIIGFCCGAKRERLLRLARYNCSDYEEFKQKIGMRF